ncbi:MAG: NAD-dependent epimerase/dehydratase family protein, partial [Frankiales bacterium]|nr:NAD-dependent epimerase/dehydratase family protein [Frankiales bacterium]
MVRPAAAVRRRRTPGPLRIAVTGGATGLGAALLERLAVRPDLAALFGVDDVPGRVDGVSWRCHGPLTERLAGTTTVVHLAMSYDVLADPTARRALNVAGTAELLEAAREADVTRVVLVSSADVYGAQPDRPLPVTEDAPLLAAADSSLTGDLVELERLADHAGRTGLQVAVLRPTALVAGRLGSAYDGALLHSLSATRLLALRGVEPRWQLCHVEDLLTALELATTTALGGALVVTSPGSLTQREVEELAGR